MHPHTACFKRAMFSPHQRILLLAPCDFAQRDLTAAKATAENDAVFVPRRHPKFQKRHASHLLLTFSRNTKVMVRSMRIKTSEPSMNAINSHKAD